MLASLPSANSTELPLSTTVNEDSLRSAAEQYEAIDTIAIRNVNPAEFDQKVRLLSTSAALDRLFSQYSIDPIGDLERLASLLTISQTHDQVERLEGNTISVTPGTNKPFENVDAEEESPLTTARAGTCWKTYVGLGVCTMVTGFYCALLGGLAVVCEIAAAGNEVDWNRYC